MLRERDMLTLAEGAWLLQVPEDTLYRRCRRGSVHASFQVGRRWFVYLPSLRLGLEAAARYAADLLARGEIEIVPARSRWAVPPPLSVHRSVPRYAAGEGVS